MKINRLCKKLSAAALLMLASNSVLAHKWLYDPKCGANEKWYRSSMTFNANPTGFTGKYAKWLTSFKVALDRINNTPANFNMYARLDNDYYVKTGNGESEIWWAKGVSAVEYTTTSSCGRTVETDIIFHNNIPNGGYLNVMTDKTQFRGYGKERRTFESTAIHELGHALGLGHENRYYNIMGNDYTHLHTTGDNALRSYAGEDATSGLIKLYGSSTRQDLSVAQWRRTGSSGQYSSHSRTRLLDTSGTELPATKVQSSCTRPYCEMRHDVELGQTIQFEMTLENNGTHSQTVQLGYYISTNGSITNTDTLIGTDTVTVTRDKPDTVKKTVTIPATLSPHTNYYLGVIIDNAGAVSEWVENNNSAYIYIRTGQGTANTPPTARANGPYNGSAGSAVSFSSSGSTDSDGTISSYSWDFGDGSPANTSPNPTHTYSRDGSYNVILTVTDNGGLTGTDRAVATIGSVVQPGYCTVTGGGTYEHIAGVQVGGINNTSAQSNYGDYTSQTASLVSGSNNITLTPGFPGGRSYIEHWSVWIDYNNDGDFLDPGEQAVSGLSGSAEVSASFTPPSSASGTTRMRIGMQYNLAPDDPCAGIRSGEFEDYSVSFGSTGGNLPPIANANGPYSAAVNVDINFNSNGSRDPDGTIDSYSWNFGDGTSSNVSNPKHAYSSAGAFTASLTVIDNGGKKTTDSATVTIGGGTDPGGLTNACATQSPVDYIDMQNGTPYCVTAGSPGDDLYFYFSNNNGATSATIKTGHGTGDVTLYHKVGDWPDTSTYDNISNNAGNTETITINNLASGWHMILIDGEHSDVTIQMDKN